MAPAHDVDLRHGNRLRLRLARPRADPEPAAGQPEALGNAIKPYYGRAAGNRLTTLLTEHIELAVPVLVAAKAGDNDSLGKAVEDWYRNARQVGNFLARTNPAWKSARGMMKEHITQTVAYASDQLQGDFARSIKDYDAAEMHMVMLGDQISAGIVKEFPRRFRARRFR